MADYLFIDPDTDKVRGFAQDFDSLRGALEGNVIELTAGDRLDVFRVVGARRRITINEETVRRVEIE